MKTNKQRISLLLVAVMLISIFAGIFATTSKPTFTDVPTNHWAYDAIEDMSGRGVVSGYGNGKFGPNDNVTPAQFSIMLSRLFYNDELNAMPAGYSWWVSAANLLMDKGVFENTTAGVNCEKGIWDDDIMNAPMNRYDMAQMMYGVLKAKGVELPGESELAATAERIADYKDIPSRYVDAVTAMYTIGCLAGVDSVGNFRGENLMTRAQACVVLVRLMENVDGSKTPETPETPEPPVETQDPAETQKPSGSVVGTISDTPVTLSLETHKPVVDYWSDQPAEIRAITDKDAFNAACSTIANAETIITQGEINKIGVNKYYNYAVFADDASKKDKIDMVWKAISLMHSNKANYGGGVTKGIGYFKATPISDSLQEIFAPIFAKFTPGMSDREKATICVQAVVDRFEYKAGGTFNWENGRTEGDCDSYANATLQILQAAGISCTGVIAADTSYGPHGWIQALIDGEWVIIDGPSVENGHPMFRSFADHAAGYGYDASLNNKDVDVIARALIDIADK